MTKVLTDEQLSRLHGMISDLEKTCIELREFERSYRSPPDLPEASRSSQHSG